MPNFKRDAWMQWMLLLGPIALGLVGSAPFVLMKDGSAGPMVGLALMVSGFLLFLIAKLSLICRGKLVTFGSREMTPVNRWMYRLGYLLMLLGAFSSWTFLVVDLGAH